MPDQDTNHPWSSFPAAQAAVRRAEGEPGLALQHRDLPEAVERLVERGRALEFAIRELRTQRAAAAASVSSPADFPASENGAKVESGLRTERVTLEVTHRSGLSAGAWSWRGAVRHLLFPGESVHVVPTPGPGLTDDEREALRWWCGSYPCKPEQFDQFVAAIHALLARDAAARESGNSDAELGSELGSTVARLTAERDAAIRERDEARTVATNLDASNRDAIAERDEAIAERDAALARVAELEAARAAPTRVVRLPRWIKYSGGVETMTIMTRQIKEALDAAGVKWEVEE